MKIIYKEFKIYEYKKECYGRYYFNDGINVLRNDPSFGTENQNKVGKSSILKSMMHCMGLTVKNWDPDFRYNEMIFTMQLQIDEKMVDIIRFKDYFKINRKKILTLREYKDELSKLLKIDLKLEHRNSTKKITPYPEDYLMYFYIDQDSSWGNKLFLHVNSSLAKYKTNAYKHIFNYLVGIDDDKIVEVNNRLQDVKNSIKQLENQLEMINYSKSIIINDDYVNIPSFTKKDLDVSIDNFEIKYNKLFKAEKDFKRKLYNNSKKINELLKNQDELELIFGDLVKKEKEKNISKCSFCDSELNTDLLIKKYKIENEKFEVAELYNDFTLKIETLKKKRKEYFSNLDLLKKELESIKESLDKIIEINTLNDLINLRVEEQKANDFEKAKLDKETKLTSQSQIKSAITKELNQLKKLHKERKQKLEDSYLSNLGSLDLLLKENISLDKYTTLLDFRIKDTGTTKNIVELSLFMAYFSLLNDFSILDFPIIVDTVIKDDHDHNNLSAMSKIINDYYFSFDKQVFYSYVNNEKFKLSKENIHYINIKDRVCNIKFTEDDIAFVDSLSLELLENGKNDMI